MRGHPAQHPLPGDPAMGGHQQMGLLLVVAGAVIALVGIVAWLGGLSWFGHLPGDIRVVKPSYRFYFPITSMLVLSLVLTVLVNLLRRLL